MVNKGYFRSLGILGRLLVEKTSHRQMLEPDSFPLDETVVDAPSKPLPL